MVDYELLQRMKSLYTQGYSTTEVAEMVGLSQSYTAQLLRMNGAKMRRKGIDSVTPRKRQYFDEKYSEIISLAENLSVEDIAKIQDVSDERIKQILGKTKAKQRWCKGELERLPSANEIITLLKTHSAIQIANIYGVKRQSVYRCLYKNGIMVKGKRW